MSTIFDMSWQEVYDRGHNAWRKIVHSHRTLPEINIYAIPNGGIYAAQALFKYNLFDVKSNMVESPANADIYVDDVYDSGKTLANIVAKYGKKPAYFLVDKREEFKGVWVRFPWERMSTNQPSGAEDNVTRMIQFIGEDQNREGLRDTPKRVVKSWKELYAGYSQDPKDLLTTFESDGYDEMVVLKDVEFVSMCEHHMLPFVGKAAIAYIPNGKVIGISKLARLLEIYSRRLQIQERLCQQVTQALTEHLNPKGAACVISASHMCMVCRGVRKQHSVMVTSSLTGVFKQDQAARQEFMSLIKE